MSFRGGRGGRDGGGGGRGFSRGGGRGSYGPRFEEGPPAEICGKSIIY